MGDSQTFIEGLPKAELHLHLEGTLEPELKFEAAERNGIDLPYGSVEEIKAAYDFDSLTTFLVGYYEGMGVLIQEQDFYDLAYAYFTKAASQNVVYAETFFDPQGHTSRGVEFGTIIEGLHRAQQDAASNLGLRSQLIMCFLRDMSAESAMETLEQSLPYKDWIPGVGLDSDERDNPPEKFDEVFKRAKQEGYLVTAHCDVDQENSVQNIWRALDYVDTRIDHGVNSLEDDALVAEILSRGLGLTVCPISNGFVTDSMKTAEIRTMLDKGMRVTLNSDDPAYFLGYIQENFIATQQALSLTNDEVAQFSRNAFEISWLSRDEKDGYIKLVDDYVAQAG